MDMITEYFTAHHANIFYALAGISLVVEVGLIGLSGPLLFFGVACGFTGILVSLGLINSWEAEILSVALLTLLTAVALWKPLKNLQGRDKVVKDNSSDMIGQIVPVSEDLTIDSGSIRHSGINWQARLSESLDVAALAAGEKAEIIATEGNLMVVKPYQK